MSEIFGSGERPIGRVSPSFQMGHMVYFYHESWHELDGEILRDDFYSCGPSHPYQIINFPSHSQTTWHNFGVPGSGATNEVGTVFAEYWPPSGAKAPSHKPKGLIVALHMDLENGGGIASIRKCIVQTRLPGANTFNGGFDRRAAVFHDRRYYGNGGVDQLEKTVGNLIIPVDKNGQFDLWWQCELNQIDKFSLYLQGFIL